MPYPMLKTLFGEMFFNGSPDHNLALNQQCVLNTRLLVVSTITLGVVLHFNRYRQQEISSHNE